MSRNTQICLILQNYINRVNQYPSAKAASDCFLFFSGFLISICGKVEPLILYQDMTFLVIMSTVDQRVEISWLYALHRALQA